MKKILTIAACAVLAITAIAAPKKKTAVKEDSVRLLYWNIQNAMWSEQDKAINYKYFVKWVSKQNPDICVWCEAESNYEAESDRKLTQEEKYLPEAWAEVAARYGHSYVYKGGHHDRFPQVITSKFPIENVDRILGNEDTVVFHGAGWAKMNIKGREINIVTTHTYPQSYGVGVTGKQAQKESSDRYEGSIYRAKEMEYLCKHTIQSVPDAASQNWIMLGDFNEITSAENYFYQMDPATPCFLLHDYIRNNTPYIDLIDARNTKREFVPTNGRKTRRIDFVYVTKPLLDCVTRAEIIWDDYTTPEKALDIDGKQIKNFWHPSDHLPIIVDFKF